MSAFGALEKPIAKPERWLGSVIQVIVMLGALGMGFAQMKADSAVMAEKIAGLTERVRHLESLIDRQRFERDAKPMRGNP